MADFSFRDQRGAIVTKSDLAGHVWIADFVYTSCQGACPLLTSRLIAIQQQLRDPALRFVSFSVDPEHDTPEILARYAKRWHEDARWELLSTNERGLAAVLTGMEIAVSREANEIVHSNRFFLVDARGAVSESYDSADDAAIARLLSDTSRELASAIEPIASQSGAELFSKLGCAGCHDDAQLAPPLGGLFGSSVMLARGSALLADDAYIHESIVAPAAQLVAGYPNSMPAYGEMLSETQVRALVAYVHSLAGSPRAETATLNTDPVCGMVVRVSKDSPSVDFDGKSYHFCSLPCARRFQADPGKYLK
ncbi:MAG TPA: SCO family protein [Polyangiaceae bacterium]|nr:SCO family protein [Polyangiaceae bacterium]